MDQYEQDEATEKTEHPSEKQRLAFRREGRVARSKDFTAATPLLFFLLMLYLSAPLFSNSLATAFYDCLSFNASEYPGNDWLFPIKSLLTGARSLLIFILLTVSISTLCAGIIPGGLIFHPGLIAPKWQRINPVQGLKKLFSRQGLTEVTKAFLKTLTTGLFLALFLYFHATDLINLDRLSLKSAVSQALRLIWSGCLYLVLPIMVMAIADCFWQQKQMTQKLMQTRQQARENLKHEEGSPETRERIRQLRKELSPAYRQQMLKSVPDADFIISNPTHYAVALKYDSDTQSAPIAIARGVDLLALQIIRLARDLRKPVFSQPRLARSLYHQSRVGKEIDPEFYSAIAQVIIYLHQIDQYHRGESQHYPEKPVIHLSEHSRRYS